MHVERRKSATGRLSSTGSDQVPHREDEIDVVIKGRALLVDGQRHDVAAGSAVYGSAGRAHRFTDVVEDLTVLVVFAPPYSGR